MLCKAISRYGDIYPGDDITLERFTFHGDPYYIVIPTKDEHLGRRMPALDVRYLIGDKLYFISLFKA